nr:reverse transcriptase family protein [uncultured Rhodoferax sp.]
MSTVLNPLPETQKKPIEVLFAAMFHGKWRFADFAGSSIEASISRKTFTQSGKTRNVVEPNEKLKGFHEFLRLFLLDYLPLNKSVVFSYRKGVSAYDSVAMHARSRSFFVCDIADFFPSIRRSRIKSTLLTAKDSCPIEDIDSWLDRIVDLVSVNDSLPMGFSTSPAISNAALTPFDDALLAYCNSRELVLTRYSDDIIVSGKDSTALEGVQDRVAAILKDTMQGELSLHPNKSKFLNNGSKVKLLGMVLLPNGTVSVDASVKDEIEVLIHYYLRDRSKFADRGGGDSRKAEARLSGLLNYANSVDQVYLDKLRKKFGLTVVDYFLRRSFS